MRSFQVEWLEPQMPRKREDGRDMSRIPRGESVFLQFILAASLAAFAPGTLSCAAGEADWISVELAKPVLGADAGRSSWLAVLAEVKRADAACDAAWRRMKTREELQRYGKDLRSRMIRAMGGFPSERCPLNARTVSVQTRDGYTVENVLFESWPGVHVSASLYLPDAARFPPPHPGVLIVCGHGGAGKSAPSYSRGGVMSSRAGIAALVVDPLAQGERVQERGKDPAVNWEEHNRIGSLAVLLGGGFPRFRVWDAMRALDYLETRPDIDAKALGCMGNSGGGNVTAFLQAVDPRLAATAPAGYVCSFSRAAEKATISPGAAPQRMQKRHGAATWKAARAAYVHQNYQAGLGSVPTDFYVRLSRATMYHAPSMYASVRVSANRVRSSSFRYKARWATRLTKW